LATGLLAILAMPSWSVGQTPSSDARTAVIRDTRPDKPAEQATATGTTRDTRDEPADANRISEKRRASTLEAIAKSLAKRAVPDQEAREADVKKARAEVEALNKEFATGREQLEKKMREAEDELRVAQKRLADKFNESQQQLQEAHEKLIEAQKRLDRLQGPGDANRPRRSADITTQVDERRPGAAVGLFDQARSANTATARAVRATTSPDLERRMSELERKFDLLLEEVRSLKQDHGARNRSADNKPDLPR